MRKAVSYLILLSALFSCADGIGVQETGGRISVELMADVPVKSPTVLTPEEASMYRISVLDASGNPAVHESPQEKKGQQIPTVYYKDFETVTVLLDQQYQVTAERSAFHALRASRNSGSLSESGWSTGMLCSTAYFFTALSFTFSPRPLALSATVTTPTIL